MSVFVSAGVAKEAQQWMLNKGRVMREWSDEILQDIAKVFYTNDLSTFEKAIVDNPRYLRFEDGTDAWMWSAAMNGNLDMLKLLVGLGLDVNLTKDAYDPENPFALVEGPIVHAASNGHVDVVRWLLEKGAKSNFVVNGKNRCLPLLDAATHGHFEVVKLLVENGADIHAEFNGHTALSLAENYGHSEIAEYLRSVGAVK